MSSPSEVLQRFRDARHRDAVLDERGLNARQRLLVSEQGRQAIMIASGMNRSHNKWLVAEQFRPLQYFGTEGNPRSAAILFNVLPLSFLTFSVVHLLFGMHALRASAVASGVGAAIFFVKEANLMWSKFPSSAHSL
eukprot:TRINITY_DN57278_c0_g1_i1.p2 TRINITY_DN57278_c0_g1~~TRINITY_DN57278_c0_g1_i1.p2  ORF type:complete len:152 (+),score=7.07 TRINITY_DN57278_c0_g1_i1:51-458(+)